jgi:hypothetical protein
MYLMAGCIRSPSEIKAEISSFPTRLTGTFALIVVKAAMMLQLPRTTLQRGWLNTLRRLTERILSHTRVARGGLRPSVSRSIGDAGYPDVPPFSFLINLDQQKYQYVS